MIEFRICLELRCGIIGVHAGPLILPTLQYSVDCYAQMLVFVRCFHVRFAVAHL
jgi:hypothetical protein